jgi:ABC-type sugar transport system ATPase subunit
MLDVSLDAVSVRRGSTVVLDHASMHVDAGELAVLLGGSGAGKTTLLRAVAGLEEVVAGTLRIGGRDMSGVAPGERGVSLTFQQPVLFPRRNVARNIGFPLELRKATADEIAERVGVEARLLKIDQLLRRDVDELSYGEAQMVQVARSLVRGPSVLLLDEPFASLDGELVEVLRRELMMMQRAFGVTTLMATNDPHGMLFLADRVVVLERGAVVQQGPPREVYERPDTATSAMLTGEATLLPVDVEVDADGAWLVHRSFRLRAWAPALRRHAGRRLQMVTRPEWWALDQRGVIGGVVERVSRWEGTTSVVCDVNGLRVVARAAPGELDWRGVEVGGRIGLRLQHWVLLDPLDGRRIDLGSPSA